MAYLCGKYVVELIPDDGIERLDMKTMEPQICTGYYCRVYLPEDIERSNYIDDFCLAHGFDLQDDSEAAIRKALAEYFGISQNEVIEECIRSGILWLTGFRKIEKHCIPFLRHWDIQARTLRLYMSKQILSFCAIVL